MVAGKLEDGSLASIPPERRAVEVPERLGHMRNVENAVALLELGGSLPSDYDRLATGRPFEEVFQPDTGEVMREQSRRDVEKVYGVSEFAAKLRRLADALEDGKPFEIQVAGERLHVPAGVHFSVEHERAEGIEELEFQLRWERS